MVHRSADSRLLANLISHEKEYTNQLQSLLNLSHASFNSLSAYAASSPPPASQVILAVASSLSNVDNALRVYAAAVEEWTKYLKELKDLEDEVGNVMRDREILVTRLLKASKSTPKPSSNRDSLMFSPSPSPPASSSTLSLKSNEDPSTTYASTSFFSALSPGPMSANKKLQTAQAELQACEAHLAKKELELDGKRSSAIRDGLRIRFRALAQCGWRWTETGKEVEIVLGFGEQVSTPQTSNKPLPALLAPVPVHAKPPTAEFNDRPSSDLSSIAPSQSASQIGIIVGSSPPINSPTAHIYSDLEVASGPSPASSPSLHIPIPPAHSIDDLTLPTADSDATITRSSTRRHVLPHRITEEDLGFHEGLLSGTKTSMDKSQEDTGDSDSDEDDERITAAARVVENPRFSAKNVKSTDANQPGSISSLSKANGVDIVNAGKGRTSNINATASNTNGFFGSIRGLFTRSGKPNDRRGGADSSPGTTAAITDDNSSIDEFQHPGIRGKSRTNKTRIGILGGRNRKKGQVGIFNDDEEEGGSVMSSPPAPLRMPDTTYSDQRKTGASGSSPLSTPVPRGRTMSEAHPSIRTTTDAGRKLKKSGPGVGLRGKTVSNDLADGELKQRRRSASVDYGDLSVRSRDASRPKSRAEEWVDGQQHESITAEDKNRNEGETDEDKPVVSRTDDEVGGGASSLTQKGSVKRRRSANRRSLPVSLPASASVKSASTSALVLPTDTVSTSTPVASTIKNAGRSLVSSSQDLTERSASVSRNSSLRSVGSAPSGSHIHNTARTSITRAHTLTVTPGTSSSVTPRTDRRASSPPMSVSTGTGHGGLAGVGSTSLMSIVEDVAKTNREAWGKAAAEEDLTTSTSSKSVGETIKPSGFLEAVKAPRSIDFEDLKEQMDRDLRENRGQNHHQHQAQYTGRARSGSDSAAAPHHEHDIGPSASASAPLLAAIPVINKNNSQAQDKLTPSTHKPGQAILPLRSALKNSSRTPSPMQRPPQSLPAVAGQSKQLGGSGESSSPSGSQLGSNVSTAGSSGSERSGKSGTVILAQHQPTRTASPLANSISVVPSQRDVKGKGKERLDDSAFAVLPGTIFSPPQSNLSTSTPSPSPATSMQTVYENPNKSTLMREQSGSGSDSGSDSSDAASISSYETGLEAFDDVVEDSGDETETGQGPSTPPPHEVAYHLNGGRSDVSSSSTSTSTLTQTQKELQNAIANTSIPGLTQSNTAVNSITIITHSSPPRRRKSVRVSLQPTYSVTPPAIEYEDEDEIGIGAEEHASDTDESEASGENRKSVHDERQTDGVARQDIWADSSDEDVEYQKARKLFSVSSALAKKSNGKKAKSTTHR